LMIGRKVYIGWYVFDGLKLNVDGSLVPLGSTATHDPIGIPKSLWARWNPLGVTMNLYKMIGMTT